MWMGLCSFPTIENYWSKKEIYKNGIARIMSRNPFQLLLKMLHFNNNEEITDDRLHKLRPLISILRKNFQQQMIPSEYVCIDETLVPFRERLRFRHDYVQTDKQEADLMTKALPAPQFVKFRKQLGLEFVMKKLELCNIKKLN